MARTSLTFAQPRFGHPVVAVLLAFLAAVAFGFVVPSPAKAGAVYGPNCAPNDQCHSQLQEKRRNFGGKMTTHLNYMNPGVKQPGEAAQINTSVWVNMGNGNWVEAGIYNGMIPPDGPRTSAEGNRMFYYGNNFCPQGCMAYVLYWADRASNGDLHFHTIKNLTPTGETVWFEIRRNFGVNYRWDVTVNYPGGTYNGYSTVTGSNESIRIDMGGEYVGRLTDEGSCADKFEMHGWWSDGGSWYQFSHPAGSDYYLTDGLGAHMPAPWTWVWWKDRPGAPEGWRYDQCSYNLIGVF